MFWRCLNIVPRGQAPQIKDELSFLKAFIMEAPEIPSATLISGRPERTVQFAPNIRTSIKITCHATLAITIHSRPCNFEEGKCFFFPSSLALPSTEGRFYRSYYCVYFFVVSHIFFYFCQLTCLLSNRILNFK